MELENQETLARWDKYLETGAVISNNEMMNWLDSWGSDQKKTMLRNNEESPSRVDPAGQK